MTSRFNSVDLGELVEVLDSKRKPIAKKDRKAGPYPYYGATGIVDHVDGYIFETDLILLGEDGAKWGPGDRSAFSISGKSWVNNHAHVLRPYREQCLDRWLVYFLNFADLSDFISGVTVPKLNQAKMRSIPIPLPPLEEQHAIVDILDEAFAGLEKARANAEANLESAKELFQSALEETFSGKLRQQNNLRALKQVAQFKPPKRLAKDTLQDDDKVSFVPMECLQISRPDFNEKEQKTLSEVYGYTYFANGDVILAKITPCFENGKLGIAKGLTNEIGFGSSEFFVLRPNQELNAEFLYYYLDRNSFRKWAGAQMTGAVGHKRVPKELVEDLIMPVPEINEQHEVANRLNSLRNYVYRLQEEYKRQLCDLDELKQSLLQKAFAGELT